MMLVAAEIICHVIELCTCRVHVSCRNPNTIISGFAHLKSQQYNGALCVCVCVCVLSTGIFIDGDQVSLSTLSLIHGGSGVCIVRVRTL